MKKCFMFHDWSYIIRERRFAMDSVERICNKCNKHQIKIDVGCADFRWLNVSEVERVENDSNK